MTFPTYPEARRWPGGILKFLYDKVKDAAEGILAAGSVSSDELANGAVIEAKLATGAVTSGKLGAAAVTAAKMKVFVSDEIQQSGGGAVSTPHGLGVTPSIVLAVPTATGAAGAFTVVYGTHTSTNCVITVTDTAKYKIIAIA